MSGAYVSGDRVRGNYSDSKDFNRTFRYVNQIILIRDALRVGRNSCTLSEIIHGLTSCMKVAPAAHSDLLVLYVMTLIGPKFKKG